ncbi:MAG: hypothetical protein BGO87_07415 [Flavobacteriia bacterium 40-80]|uniref:hypothetical protein n=1 Tax=uncultured Flavobacterium sp. TaxID=165435 RepID=UPI0009628A37|nr:hypothetical protein [uncultured Flavobacterium sp.]OJX36274.1 MAG: hypothetical protein BGO87_07415 [Flavobacteriia bacterium 40-80]
MDFSLIYEIGNKLKNIFSSDKIYPLWRFILCFFSTDFFIKFNYKWITDIKDISSIDLRTIEILYFAGVFILVWWSIYNILEIPLRLLFHGYVKKKIFNLRNKLNQGSEWDKKRGIMEFVAIIAPFFHKYLFKYGILSSNNLSEPINIDFESKEQEFNEIMTILYRWNLTIIHTLLVAIIVWKFYAIWFFIVVVLVLAISIILTVVFMFFALNLDYLEPVRQQLLKENKKQWK